MFNKFYIFPTTRSSLIPRQKKLFSSIFLVMLGIAGTAASEELDRIIVVAEQDVVMESELATQMDKVRFQIEQQGTRMPPNSVLERQVLERLVLEKIQLQVASDNKIQVTEDALALAISDMAKQNNLSLPQFKEILASENYEFDMFKEQIRQEILITKLRKSQVDDRVRVRESEIQNYLRNESTGADDQEYRISHILVSTPSGADNNEIRMARNKAEEAFNAIQSGTPFGDIAISVSDGQQALEGGDLGWRKGSEIPSLFADSVSTLSVGEHSGIITNPSGYHLIELTDKRSIEDFMIPQYKTRHVLIKPNALLTKTQALNRINQLKMRLEIDGDVIFSEMARNNSDDRTSALQGGDLGWVNEGQMVPEFDEIMTAIEPGEISPPFESEFGFHILQVVEKRMFDGSEEIKKDRARRSIRQQKLDERRQFWLRRLRDEAYVEYRK